MKTHNLSERSVNVLCRILLILLCLKQGALLSAQNTAPDPVLLNQEFLKVINEHRASKRLKPLVLEEQFYPFVLAHSQTLAKDDDAHHNRF